MRHKTRTTWNYVRQELRGRTLALAATLALLLFLFAGLVSNLGLFAAALVHGRLPIVFGLIRGIYAANYWYAFVLIVIISVLAGINIALVLRRAHRLRETGATGAGSLLGLVVGGCSGCATGLLPLLGLSFVVGLLPFQGIELSVLSVVLLLVALYWNAETGTCRI